MYRNRFVLAVLLGCLVVGGALYAEPISQAGEGQEYVVQVDDWLSTIAGEYLGDASAYGDIFEATNAKAAEDGRFGPIRDPHLIIVGQRIWIPAVPMASMDGGAVVELRLLETTDIHVHIANYDYFRDREDNGIGLSQTATLIKQAIAEVPNSLLVDNGDLIQGNPLGDYMARVKGVVNDIHPVYKAMNTLPYVVANIGNHEFNYGLDYLKQTLAGADFPYISANVYDADTGESTFTPYVIDDYAVTDVNGEEHNIKVGFIGFVPPQIMLWDKSHLEGLVTAADIVETAKKYVPQMKAEGADIIVAIPHSGLYVQPAKGGDENAVYYLSTIAGIDAILFGHSHRTFPGPDYDDLENVDNVLGTVNGTAAVMPGFWGNHLGIIDLTLQQVDGEWKSIASRSEVRPVSERVDGKLVPLVETDSAIIEAIAVEHAETLEWIRQPFGEATAPINSFFALVRDDPSIQIVTDAQKWYVERLLQGTEYDGMPVLSAGAPFKAGGRGGPDNFTDVPAGVIAFKNVADLYIYPNTLKVVQLTGAEVREWLEMSAGQFNQIDIDASEPQMLVNDSFPTYNFDVIDGVTYDIDISQPSRYDPKGNLINPGASRIVNLQYDGRPVADGKKFVVATNNYRASGGGNFPGVTSDKIIIDAPDENRQVLANYIAELGQVNPSADMNWDFAAIPHATGLLFRTSPSETAAKFADQFDNISYDGRIDEEGFAMYRIDLSK